MKNFSPLKIQFFFIYLLCLSAGAVAQSTSSTTAATVFAWDLPYNWNGSDYNNAGTYTFTTTNAAGYDSVATLVLSVRPSPAAPPPFAYPTPNLFPVNKTITPLIPGGYGYGLNSPYGVALDTAGNMYVTDYNNNAVKKITADGVTTVFASGFTHPVGVALDKAGNIFVTESSNIKKITPSGTITLFATGFNIPHGVAVDTLGNVYVVEYGNNAVKKITPDGVTATTIGSGFLQPEGVAVDAAGNVYVADGGNNVIKKIAPDGVTVTTIGAGFNGPAGIAVDATGYVYVADYNNSGIKIIGLHGGVAAASSGGTGLSQPLGVAVDTAGFIYVADGSLSYIKKFKSFGNIDSYSISPAQPDGLVFNQVTGIITGTPVMPTASTIYTVTAQNGSGNTNTLLSIATGAVDTICPSSLPYHWNDSIYTAAGTYTVHLTNAAGGDSAATLILTVNEPTTSTTPVTVYSNHLPYYWNGTAYASQGSYTFSTTNAAGCDSTATLVLSIAQPPPSSFSYITPNTFLKNVTIPPLSPTLATPVTPIGSGLSLPYGVDIDTSGNVYVADYNNSTIQKITVNGTITTLGSGFKNPVSVAVDAEGNVYVGDYGNNAVQKIAADGTVTVLASGLNSPRGVAVDGLGNVYAAEYYGDAIKKIAPNGSVTTFGSGLLNAQNIAVDAAGNVYVADGGHSAVKKIAADGVTITTLGSGFNGPTDVAVDGQGNVYVVDNLNQVIKMIAADGTTMRTLGSGFVQPLGIGVDRSGYVYVTDFGAGYIKKFAPGTPATSYAISPALPAGLAMDTLTGIISGTTLLEAAIANYTVTGYNTSGDTTTTITIAVNIIGDTTRAIVCTPALPYVWNDTNYNSTGTYTHHFTTTARGDSTVTLVLTVDPVASETDVVVYGDELPYNWSGSAYNAAGTYTFDTTNGAGCDSLATLVLTVKPARAPGQFTYHSTNVFVKNARIAPLLPSNMFTVTDTITNPGYVATDAAGNLYVTNGTTVKKITAGSNTVTTVATGLMRPQAITVDSAGNTYVLDYNPHIRTTSVDKISPDGSMVSFSAGFANAGGIVVDAAGNMYVGEQNMSTPAGYIASINKISPDGATITPITTTLTYINNLAIDSSGNIFAYGFYYDFFTADYKVIKIEANSGSESTIDDGHYINAITTDADGNWYALYYDNNSGNYLLGKWPASGGGPVVIANIGMNSSIPAIAADGEGNVYFPDQNNSAIRKISATGGVASYTVSPGLPAGLTLDAATGVISGTPTAISDSTVYVVTAGSIGGTTTDTLAIIVNGLAPGDIRYNSPAIFTKGNAIAPLTPAVVPAGIITANGSGFTYPNAVAADTAGNIYVADSYNNAVKKVSRDGTITTLGNGYAFNFPRAVATDAAGNVYVGDDNVDGLKKIAPGGTVTVLPALPNYYATSIVTDIYGNIYANGSGIQKIAPDGVTVSNIAAGQVSAAYIAADNNGTVYASDNGYLTKITQDDGSVTQYYLSNRSISPYNDIATDPAGNLFLVNYMYVNGIATFLLEKISPDGNTIETLATFDPNSFSPGAMTTDAAGNVYIVDTYTYKVFKVTGTGGAAASYTINPALPAGLALDTATGTISGTPTQAGDTTLYTITAHNKWGSTTDTFRIKVRDVLVHTDTVNVCATALPYHWHGMDFDSTGIYTDTIAQTSEYDTVAVLMLTVNVPTTSTTPVTVYSNSLPYYWNGTAYSSPGSYTFSTTNAAGCDSTATLVLSIVQPPPSAFNYVTPNTFIKNVAISPLSPISAAPVTPIGSGLSLPWGVAIDTSGNVYVADYNTSVIKKIAVNGTITTLGLGFFNSPVGVAVDAAGNIYVGDYGYNAVKKIATDGNITFIATGLNAPRGVAVDGVGNVYVAEYNGDAIKKIAPNGSVTTLGSGLLNAQNIAVDAAGNVYVADGGHSAVKKIAADGVTITTLGSGFNGPTSVAVDASGNVYVVDNLNQVVKMMAADGTTMRTIGSGFVQPLGIAVDRSGYVYVTDYGAGYVKKFDPGIPATSYAISPTLPAGLAMDELTGIISGTPLLETAINDYTVTGYNTTSGGTTTTVTLAVNIIGDTTRAIVCTPALPYVWYGVNYDSTGTYMHHFTTTAGGDSTLTLVLTVDPVASETNVAIYGDELPYNWSGSAYNAAGTYTFDATNAAGCDSVATLVLTVKPARVPAPFNYRTPNIFVKSNRIVPLQPSNVFTVTTAIANPMAIARDAAGNLYAIDSRTVKKLTAGSNTITTVATGLTRPLALTVDLAGNIYILDYNFRDPSTPAWVDKISPNGSMVVFSTGLARASGIVVDAAGNMYVGEQNGSPNYIASINKISPDGATITPITTTLTTIYNMAIDSSGNIVANGFYYDGVEVVYRLIKIQPANGAINTVEENLSINLITADAAGNLYGIYQENNSNNYLLGKWPASGGGPVVMANLGPTPNPTISSMVADPAGNIYFSDYAVGVINKVPAAGGAGTYTISPALPAGLTLNTTTGVISGTPTATSDSTVYAVTATNIGGATTDTLAIMVNDLAPGDIRYNSPAIFTKGNAVAPLTPAPVPAGIITVKGSGFYYSGGIAADTAGNIYVAHTSDNAIKKISRDGTITTLGNGYPFSSPQAIATDAAGNVYVVDNSGKVIKITRDGTVTQLQAQLPFGPITSMVADSYGNLYTTTTSSPGIQKIAPDGITVKPVATGQVSPYYIAADNNGTVYGSPDNGYIWKITGGGQNVIANYLADKGINSTFGGIATDPAGNLFLSNVTFVGGGDVFDLKKISHGGDSIQTLATFYSGSFNQGAMTTDAAGNVYIMDPQRFNLYKITGTGGGTATSYTINPALPAGLILNTTTGIISGTPTQARDTTLYMVTARNKWGSTTDTFRIKVRDVLLHTDTVNVCLPAPPYHWHGRDFTSTGIYRDTIVSTNDYDSIAILRLTVSAPPTAAIRANQQITTACYGLTRNIIATPAGGTAPYLYSLDGTTWQGSATFAAPAGTYHITIKDINGCTANTPGITITQPAEKLVITGTQVTGADITVTATGGYGGYTYSLDGGAYSTSNTLTGVSAGIDTVRVHDQGGCIAAARVNILTATITYDGGNNMVCYNRNKVITIAPAGGVRPYRYTFDGNTAGRIMLAAPGTHTITVQDAAGNSYSTGITITAPAEKLNLTLAHSNVSCAGGDGTITALPSGGYAGYTYSLNSGSYAGENVFNNLDAGTYTVSVQDAAGCTSPVRTAIVKVPVNPCPGLRSGDEPTSSKGEMAGALVVKVMPNPAVVEFTLQVVSGDSKKVVEIRVMDMLGRTVYHTRGSVFDSYRFGRNFAGGMYIAEVLNGTSVQRVKLVKGN